MLTHLSEKFLEKIKINNNKQEFILQLIDFKNERSNGKKISIVELSNGILKENIYINPNMETEKLNLLKNSINNILKVFLIKSKDILILLDYEIKIKYNKKIGNSICFSEYKENNYINQKGNNMIPEKLVEVLNEDNKINSFQNDLNYTPIKLLTPNDNNVILKARCIQKTEIRDFYKKKGRLFSCELIDKSGSIKASFFNDIIDSFYNVIQEGKVYQIKNIELKFSNYHQKLEVYFKKSSIIKNIPDDEEIPKNNFKFVNLSELENKNLNDIVDVICIIQKIGEIKTINNDGVEKYNRNIVVIDDSNKLIELIIWGDDAKNFDLEIGKFMILYKAKIIEFNRLKQLKIDYNSKLIEKIPNIEEYINLIKWKKNNFDNYKNMNIEESREIEVKHSLKTFEKIVSETQNLTGTTKFFNTIGYISYIKDNLFYLSCPNDNCRKKAISNGNLYNCEKCNSSFDEPTPRFLPLLKISDSTSNIYATSLNSYVNKKIFEKTSNELYEIQQNSEEDFQQYLESRKFIQYKMTIKASEYYYEDQKRIQYNIIRLVKLNSNYSKILFDLFDLTLKEYN